MRQERPSTTGDVGPRHLFLRTAGTAPITRGEVIRNNQVVFSADPRTDVREEEWTDTADLAAVACAHTFPADRPLVFYYLRLFQANRQRAGSSPIWFSQSGRLVAS